MTHPWPPDSNVRCTAEELRRAGWPEHAIGRAWLQSEPLQEAISRLFSALQDPYDSGLRYIDRPMLVGLRESIDDYLADMRRGE